MFDLFDLALAWGVRNADEHGVDLETQERWVTLTEEYLPRAAKRVKNQQLTGQRSLTAHAGWTRTPRILS
jgi:hypothetical protein